MQLPAGVDDLPHTRSHAVHWLTTAALLGAVTGAAALLHPPGATATPERAAQGPDPASAEFPLDCGPHEVAVTDHVAVDFDEDGRAETVAAVRCDAGSGTPPHGVYVLSAPGHTGGAPHLAETLLDPGESLTVEGLAAAGGTVSVRLLGYSSDTVPRCCPDQERDVSWGWRDGRLELRANPVPGAV